MHDLVFDLSAGRATTSWLTRALPALLAGFVGAVLVLGAGFASPSSIHTAAHDARHSFAFPCH
jgi:cobalt transporter subunit CbtB